jgi:diguanylate cyclase (GGDEF)-like protein
MVARYGGDEFMILLPHTTKTVAAEIAERIRRAVETTPLISESEVASVTLSLGVSTYPEDGKSTDALVEAADRSMYKAKERGGNAVVLGKSP